MLSQIWRGIIIIKVDRKEEKDEEIRKEVEIEGREAFDKYYRIFYIINGTMIAAGSSMAICIGIFHSVYYSIGNEYYMWNVLLMVLGLLMTTLANLIYIFPSIVLIFIRIG